MADHGTTDGTGADRGEEALYRARATSAGLAFVGEAAAAGLAASRNAALDDPAQIAAAIRTGRLAFVDRPEGRLLFIAPTEEETAAFRRQHGGPPGFTARLRVTTPRAIRGMLLAVAASRLAEDATGRLAATTPDLSARLRVTPRQTAPLVATVLLLLGAGLVAPMATLAALNLLAGLLFLAVALLRLGAAELLLARRRAPPSPRAPDETLPAYSILVPLLDEAAMVPALVAALDRLDWPHDKLDVKFLVEAHDVATRRALEGAAGAAHYEILVVPPVGPRTKPKALSFALPLCRGAFVAVYDAEDRPDPAQLRAAAKAFAAGGRRLGCVQAPLVAVPRRGGWVEQLFALEYATLFDGLLPALARLGMPLPLGGTSNHFRTGVLDEIGGWDPFNMTEDADLGIRLARLGYRSETIAPPTIEETPPTAAVWLKQRTRWFKGWVQTFFVHTRRPLRLFAELGPVGSFGFTLTVAGMIVSAAIHPLWLGTVAVAVVAPALLAGDGGLLGRGLLAFNLGNLALGYAAYVRLGLVALAARRRRPALATLALVPVYWLMMSAAVYRAFWQFLASPHRWEKTPHGAKALTPRVVYPS
ncbi:glycosyltransferase family 2 protein [Prosthecomicrobium pneumaticum]|uniref:Glycosyltransferase 2-like domain-containing protein n=1 Tax=Prosthecomicrobium pneumaticum TaxID=81895 RepID=A0A7W9L2C5_9HYPH|nr:glycosyltransferase family 2 protein [Prosthecomicrobium pneumaticum]MBB5753368.1 hypothetical protein [Prosthecomicrobium pneumaticum]